MPSRPTFLQKFALQKNGFGTITLLHKQQTNEKLFWKKFYETHAKFFEKVLIRRFWGRKIPHKMQTIIPRELFSSNFLRMFSWNKDKPVAAILQRTCFGGILFVILPKII